MTAKRFIRTIAGEIYDSENDSFIHQDYVGKPIEYEDECIKLLNELHEENKYLKSLKWNQDCINEISIGISQRQLLEEENEQLRQHDLHLNYTMVLAELKQSKIMVKLFILQRLWNF